MMKTIIFELRAAEGGNDAKDLVRMMLSIYESYCRRLSYKLHIDQELEGRISGTITGADVLESFKDEAGGHRWQRVPPTEKKGRIQTSTVTVSILDPSTYVAPQLNWKDVKESLYSGTGAGGQHRNKCLNCVRLIHVPTGISACAESRSLSSNRENARKELERRFHKRNSELLQCRQDEERSRQVGAGMRGDKRRTYRVKDDIVVDHVTNKRASLKRIMQGELNLLSRNN